ncbi:MAG: cytochrome-c peroxidase [Cellvibrionaceae bacterium]
MARALLVIAFYIGAIVFVEANDTVWTENELRILRSLSLKSLSSVPPSPSNRYVNSINAQVLGKNLFYDKALSVDGTLSCASCHQPEKYFTDGLPRSQGVISGKNDVSHSRNAPTVVGSAWLRWFYWDGRRDSLWSQALIPFEANNEMGSSRLSVVRYIAMDDDYKQAYEGLFGKLDPEFLSEKLPKHAGPLGNKKFQDNWYRLPKSLRKNINIAYSNIGKSIAAYQRTLVPKTTRFDRYVDFLDAKKDTGNIISKDEIAGIRLFIDTKKTQCLQCHNGPLLTNRGFHNVGTGNFTGTVLDFGRLFGLQAALMDPFNCIGEYSDAKSTDCLQLRFLNKAHHIPLKGAFKVPSLRGVAYTAPYFHDGRFNSLEEVMAYYNNPPNNNGPHELKPLDLSDKQMQQLVAFMKMLVKINK